MKNPIFILCLPRTGSTLMRFVLDSHPLIWCPPEEHFIELLQALYDLLDTNSYDNPNNDNGARVLKFRNEIREEFDRIMKLYLPKKKIVWALKSVKTIENLELMNKIYPEAKYILLFRNCLDFVAAALERSRFGWRSYGFENSLYKELEKGNESNFVDALMTYWNKKTKRIIAFERELKKNNNCFRVQYEELVLQPLNTCKSLCEFLGVDSFKAKTKEQLEQTVFGIKHQSGKGDYKILNKPEFDPVSIGRGTREVPLNIPQRTLENTNELLKELGYTEIPAKPTK